MAGGDPDYEFVVEPDTTEPFGPVTKENMDVTMLVFDFSCWLENADDATSEPISAVIYPMVGLADTSSIGSFRIDYPVDCPETRTLPPDDYPLTVQSVEITDSATEVNVRVSAGTPGLTYVVSVIVSSASTKRRKQVDALVNVEQPLNPNLLSIATPDPVDAQPPLTISGSYALPMGFVGRIYIENSSGAPISLTLPPTPKEFDRVAPVDINGNAATYPVTVVPSTGDLIYTQPNFVMDVNFDDLIFEYDGQHWIILASRFGFLG